MNTRYTKEIEDILDKDLLETRSHDVEMLLMIQLIRELKGIREDINDQGLAVRNTIRNE